MARIGRPPKADEDKKVRESIYFKPEVVKWLREKSEKRDASISSFVNVIIEDRMRKDKERG